MILKIFTVYDSKVEAYKTPFFAQSKGAALRDWSDAVNDPQTMFHRHPEDYVLFELGEYDDQTGQFHQHPAPVSMGVAIEMKHGHIPEPKDTKKEGK